MTTEKNKTNKYDRLVDDLKSGKLPLTIVINAIRQSVRESKDVPDEIKDLLCGTESDAGYIFRQFQVMRDTMGRMKLAYRRGTDEKNI